MARATYIGGFAGGKGNMERVRNALGEYYEDVEAFTFADAMRKGKVGEVLRAVRGVDTYTHSAGGMLAFLPDSKPCEVHAIASPLPASVLALAGRAGIVGARMHTPGVGIYNPSDMLAVAKFDASFGRELVSHPFGNLGRVRAIGHYNTVARAAQASKDGTPVTLGYADDDSFYRFTPEMEEEVTAAGVRVVRFPGEHNDPLVRPKLFFDEYIDECNSLPTNAV